MNNENTVEQTLGRIKLIKPGDSFQEKVLADIRNDRASQSSFNAPLTWAVSAALVLSLSFNLLQSIDGTRETTLSATQTPAIVPAENLQADLHNTLQTSDVSAMDSVFRFLCLTKTAVVMDNTLQLGELRGFGEWILFEVPQNYQVTISLLPLREWNAIGEFENGTISLQLDDGHHLALQGAGIGPSSLKRGGPFPVYGNIEKIGASTDSNNAKQSPTDASGDARTSDDSTPIISTVLAGIDSTLSPTTRKYFGAFIDNDECG